MELTAIAVGMRIMSPRLKRARKRRSATAITRAASGSATTIVTLRSMITYHIDSTQAAQNVLRAQPRVSSRASSAAARRSAKATSIGSTTRPRVKRNDACASMPSEVM